MAGNLDKPEPRWQALLALIAVGGIYTALPPELSVGPRWLLFVVVLTLLVPTVVAHRVGRHSLNHILGILINCVITAALVGSVILLVAGLPNHKEAPRALLLSAASLWLTNVLTFALWYWRVDGGGPFARHRRGGYGSRAFLFPQMQMEPSERTTLGMEEWSPGFVEYLFIAFNTSAAFSPTDTPVLQRWAKLLNIVQSLISLTIVAVLVSRAVGVL
ncbi:MAG TPA: hypothetical protein VG167_05910 [Verrucomicrobiae bacterium]|nr:hypothetical protein [Verrucomicrobiae bacterium]